MKLKKRLPESRSQKRERLDAVRERERIDRELMQTRREVWRAQQDERLGIWRAWLGAFKRRLDSPDAYTRFEAAHNQWWDLLRHLGMPSADLFLAVQRERDGVPGDPEPLVSYLEVSGTRRTLGLARILRRRIRAGSLTAAQMERLRRVLINIVDLPYWHPEFREFTRLARQLDSPTLRLALATRILRGEASGKHAREMLVHLDQQSRMNGTAQPVSAGVFVGHSGPKTSA